MDTGNLINTILVVEDAAVVQAGVSMLLESFGFAVIQARNGVDAVVEYNTHHDDITLVIMNIAAPRFDGIEAIKKIRGVDPFAKVILSSDYIDQQVSEVNADAFLQNPVNGRDLWEVIQQVLRGERREKHRFAWG